MSGTSDFWNSIPGSEMLKGEGNVEHRLVLPLLDALGYRPEDIDAKPPIQFQQGRRGRKPEADFVCYDEKPHDKNSSLLAVEVKSLGEPLPPGKAQGESYAQNIRAPLLLLTNGELLEIWQMQISFDSERILQIAVSDMVSHRADIERFLNKAAVRAYCTHLKFKTIVEVTSDFSAFETAELARLKAEPHAIARRLKTQAIGGNDKLINSTQLLQNFPTGAIVVAPSGYGKTTLSKYLVIRAVEERRLGNRRAIAFEVILPELFHTEESLLEFMHKRLAACQPGVTMNVLKDALRKFGATVVCDSFDRTPLPFQSRIAAELSLFLRDYPLSQVFLLARADTKPSLALPALELDSLSSEEIRELEKVFFADKGTEHFSIIGVAPPILHALCNIPLLLRLVLEFWTRERAFPYNLDTLFRSWLSTALETEPNDTVSRARREKALLLIAQASADVSMSTIEAVDLLGSHGIPEAVLNELVQCGAVRGTDAALEIVHEMLSDYLRAKAFAEKSISDQLVAIPSLPLARGSFLLVLLMARLADRSAQDALWKHLASGAIDNYLEAFRYRIDASGELKKMDTQELSERYLTDLLKGIEEPLDSFFPALRPSVVEWLAEERDKALSITGSASVHGLHYKIEASEVGTSRVLIGQPDFPGTIRGVNLDAARYRLDSARLLGTSLLKSGIKAAIDDLDVRGGPLWSSERLISRVQLLVERHQLGVSFGDTLDHLETIFRPFSDQKIKESPFIGRERFSIRSVLEDISCMRAAGMTKLDLWWLRLGWQGDFSKVTDKALAKLLDQQYRRVQLVYAEIVSASLPHLSGELLYFPILPIRWKLVVRRRDNSPGAITIYPQWAPVTSWAEAGADVVINHEETDIVAGWDSVRDSLIALGRPGNVPRYGGFTTHFGFDGRAWTGYFDGATPVVSEVVSWLQDDLQRLFRNLPSSDGAFAV